MDKIGMIPDERVHQMSLVITSLKSRTLNSKKTHLVFADVSHRAVEQRRSRGSHCMAHRRKGSPSAKTSLVHSSPTFLKGDRS